MSAAIAGPKPARTGRLDRRQFVLGGALLAASVGAAALRPTRTAPRIAPGDLDRAVPKRIGSFRYVTAAGLVLPPSDELSERIYDQVLTRVYVNDRSEQVMLLIAYGSAQDSGLQLHRPESCYPAAGYSLGPPQIVPFQAGRDTSANAIYLTAERNKRTEQVFYWTRIGDAFPTSLWSGRRAILSANASGLLPDGVLVRMSTISPDRQASLRLIEAFNEALISALPAEGRRLLVGKAL